VSSGFNVQAIASATKGIEIRIVICRIMNRDDSVFSGSAIIHGSGKVITNQIKDMSIMISSFVFVFLFTIQNWIFGLLIWCVNDVNLQNIDLV